MGDDHLRRSRRCRLRALAHVRRSTLARVLGGALRWAVWSPPRGSRVPA